MIGQFRIGDTERGQVTVQLLLKLRQFEGIALKSMSGMKLTSNPPKGFLRVRLGLVRMGTAEGGIAFAVALGSPRFEGGGNRGGGVGVLLLPLLPPLFGVDVVRGPKLRPSGVANMVERGGKC
jgi:hypothetical protein